MDLWIVNPKVVERYQAGESIDAIASDCGADSKTVRRAITAKTAKRRGKHGKTGPRAATIPKLNRAREMRATKATFEVIGDEIGMSATGAYNMMTLHPEGLG